MHSVFPILFWNGYIYPFRSSREMMLPGFNNFRKCCLYRSFSIKPDEFHTLSRHFFSTHRKCLPESTSRHLAFSKVFLVQLHELAIQWVVALKTKSQFKKVFTIHIFACQAGMRGMEILSISRFIHSTAQIYIENNSNLLPLFSVLCTADFTKANLIQPSFPVPKCEKENSSSTGTIFIGAAEKLPRRSSSCSSYLK